MIMYNRTTRSESVAFVGLGTMGIGVVIMLVGLVIMVITGIEPEMILNIALVVTALGMIVAVLAMILDVTFRVWSDRQRRITREREDAETVARWQARRDAEAQRVAGIHHPAEAEHFTH